MDLFPKKFTSGVLREIVHHFFKYCSQKKENHRTWERYVCNGFRVGRSLDSFSLSGPDWAGGSAFLVSFEVPAIISSSENNSSRDLISLVGIDCIVESDSESEQATRTAMHSSRHPTNETKIGLEDNIGK